MHLFLLQPDSICGTFCFNPGTFAFPLIRHTFPFLYEIQGSIVPVLHSRDFDTFPANFDLPVLAIGLYVCMYVC